MIRLIARLMAKAPKEGADNGGGKMETAPLPIEGAGVSKTNIKELDDALADYKIKRDKRIAASKDEVPAKELVLTLFHKHAEVLQDGKGVLRYPFQDGDEVKQVYIEAAKEKIKFGKADTAEE